MANSGQIENNTKLIIAKMRCGMEWVSWEGVENTVKPMVDSPAMKITQRALIGSARA